MSMLVKNHHPDYRSELTAIDSETLGVDALRQVERFLSHRLGHSPTPLLTLNSLAQHLGIHSIHLKDESHRLGLGSFKALGGSYAVIRVVLEEASKALGKTIEVGELHSQAVTAVARRLTFACATDGNHGRSVAQGAQLVGAQSKIFVHAGVSAERMAAIERFGAEVIRVNGNYDESVAEAARVAAAQEWITVSDTSWPGYERIPGLVMQGYTALVGEALHALARPPTHVFVQAGVGGIAAAVAGHLAVRFQDDRPFFVVVDPSRAACIFESAKAGRVVKVRETEPTIMAMLDCYEASLVAWRILSRAGDAFMTVEDIDAINAMRRLAEPLGTDPAVVAGESGGVGLAGLMTVAASEDLRRQIGLCSDSRVLLINTEGATDPALYEHYVGASPHEVKARNKEAVQW
jgi:diaminopropionate ammonia-lyase